METGTVTIAVSGEAVITLPPELSAAIVKAFQDGQAYPWNQMPFDAWLIRYLADVFYGNQHPWPGEEQ